jgi:hypothetical protein
MTRFDEWWGDGEAGDEPVDGLPLAANGRHGGEITKAVIKDLKFKVSDRNRAGTSLVVEVSVARHQPVEAIVPLQYRGLIEAICRAARVQTPDPGAEWHPDVLIGCQVQIDTIHGVGKTGKEYVRVEKWHAGAEPVAAAIKSTPKRTPAAKVEAAGQGGSPDDIPF